MALGRIIGFDHLSRSLLVGMTGRCRPEPAAANGEPATSCSSPSTSGGATACPRSVIRCSPPPPSTAWPPEGTLFANHWANAAPCGPSRACLYTGTYLHHNRSVNNGTPLDARFTNVALLARDAGYDPVLFGYTDTSLDPRTLPADDPRLRSYEEVLPGFRAVLHEPWEAGSRQWGRGWPPRGSTSRPTPTTSTARSPASPVPTATARPGRRPGSPPSSRRPRSWWRRSPPGWTRTGTALLRARLVHPSPSATPQPGRLPRPLRRRRHAPVRRGADQGGGSGRPPAQPGRSCTWPSPGPPRTRPSAARCGPPTTGPRRRSTTSWAVCSTIWTPRAWPTRRWWSSPATTARWAATTGCSRSSATGTSPSTCP